MNNNEKYGEKEYEALAKSCHRHAGEYFDLAFSCFGKC